MSTARLAWLLPIAVSLLLACKGSDAAPPAALAELRSLEGTVQRDSATTVDQWVAASAGALFQEGDGLKTGPDSTAELRVGRAGVAHVKPNSKLRFRRGSRKHNAPGQKSAPDAPSLDMEEGEAVLEAGDEELAVQTGRGVARMRSNSRVRLTPTDDGTEFHVMFGGMKMESAEGGVREIGEGDSVTVGFGLAKMEKPIAPAKLAATDAPQDGLADAAPLTAEVKGKARIKKAGADQWIEVSTGLAELDVGAEVEVPTGSRIEVKRDGRTATLVGYGRYRVGKRDEGLVKALVGGLEVRATEQDVTIRVPGGVIVARALEGGSEARVDVSADDGSTQVTALSGEVQSKGPGALSTLKAGESTSLAAAADAQATDTDGTPAVEGPPEVGGLDHADLIVSAGDSLRIYDPEPPTALGLKLPAECTQGAEVKLSRGSSVRGQRQVNVSLKARKVGYKVHCLENGKPARRAAKSGDVRVLRSRGIRKPASTPPHNTILADGLKYNAMYQNLKPSLDIKWKPAPKAKGYVLHVKSRRRTARKIKTKQPKHRFESGSLADGKHEFYFEARDTKKTKSPLTTLNVIFDNAAPAASVSEPPPAGFSAGSSTQLKGVATEGSEITVGDQKIRVREGGRFSATVPLAPGQRTLAIRFHNKRQGARYYLRRVRGAK